MFLCIHTYIHTCKHSMRLTTVCNGCMYVLIQDFNSNLFIFFLYSYYSYFHISAKYYSAQLDAAVTQTQAVISRDISPSPQGDDCRHSAHIEEQLTVCISHRSHTLECGIPLCLFSRLTLISHIHYIHALFLSFPPMFRSSCLRSAASIPSVQE